MMRSDILTAVNHTPSRANAKKKGSYTFKACQGPTLPGCDNALFGNQRNLLHPLHSGSNGNEPLLP